MVKNNKGFTLNELLGVIIIIGFIETVAIVGTVKYLEQSRKNSYRIMSQSVYQATENCILQGKCSVGEYTTDQLINLGYLSNLKNPISSKPDCSGSVKVILTSSTGLNKYSYEVTLNCEGINLNNKIKWPEEKVVKPNYNYNYY